MKTRRKAATKRRATTPTSKGTPKPTRQPSKNKSPWPFKDVDNPVSLALTHVDALFERIQKNKLKIVDETNIAQLQKLNADQLRDLNQHFNTTLDGMKEALGGDAFCLEAYSNFTKAQLKVAVEYIKALRKLRPDAKANGKKIRLGHTGSRKRHRTDEQIAAAAQKIVTKVQYLESDPETGVKSLHPTEMMDGEEMKCGVEMWIYHAKARKLGCYYAKNGDCLTIKGTTVVNFDEEKSTTKVLRHPRKQLIQFMSGHFTWMHQYWKGIRSAPKPIPERLNRHTVILKIRTS